MYVRIEVKIQYKDGIEEVCFPHYVFFSDGRLCLSFGSSAKSIELDEVEEFSITQDFGTYE